MRKYYLLITILAFSTLTFAQSIDETSKVLQLCVDLPEIQNDFPIDNSGNPKPLHIMQYPIVIPTDIALNKFGEPPVFMTRHEMYDNNIDAFFLFKKIDILSDSAFVDYSFYYDYNEIEQQVLHIKMNCIKESNIWKTVDIEFSRK